MTAFYVRSAYMEASGFGKPIRSTLRFDDEAAKRGCHDELARFIQSPKVYPAWEIHLIAKRYWCSRGKLLEHWR